MNARILKKLSKKVYEITGNKYGRVWIYHDEPFADEFLPQKYRWSSRIRHIHVVGGGPDYWGEATEPYTLFECALNDVLWTLGKQKDSEEMDWPVYPRRLTGMEVIKQLRKMYPNESAR